MPEYISTMISALIGAAVGSLGAVLVQHGLSQRAELKRRREVLVQRYLCQLQDAVESLWYRLDNLANMGGRGVMKDPYYEYTMLYALGKALASERILILDGVYAQLKDAYPLFSEYLRPHLIEDELGLIVSNHYDRIALAEALIEREGDHCRTCTYLDFRSRYETEGSQEAKWLAPAKEAIQSLPKEQMQALLHDLRELAIRLAEHTRIPVSKRLVESEGTTVEHRKGRPSIGVPPRS
jgi:hypothetical protein